MLFMVILAMRCDAMRYHAIVHRHQHHHHGRRRRRRRCADAPYTTHQSTTSTCLLHTHSYTHNDKCNCENGSTQSPGLRLVFDKTHAYIYIYVSLTSSSASLPHLYATRHGLTRMRSQSDKSLNMSYYHAAMSCLNAIIIIKSRKHPMFNHTITTSSTL